MCFVYLCATVSECVSPLATTFSLRSFAMCCSFCDFCSSFWKVLVMALFFLVAASNSKGVGWGGVG